MLTIMLMTVSLHLYYTSATYVCTGLAVMSHTSPQPSYHINVFFLHWIRGKSSSLIACKLNKLAQDKRDGCRSLLSLSVFNPSFHRFIVSEPTVGKAGTVFNFWSFFFFIIIFSLPQIHFLGHLSDVDRLQPSSDLSVQDSPKVDPNNTIFRGNWTSFSILYYSVIVLVLCEKKLRLFTLLFCRLKQTVPTYKILPVMIQVLWELLVFNLELKTKAAGIGY